MARFCQLSERRLFMKTENCNACINAFLCLNFILSELTLNYGKMCRMVHSLNNGDTNLSNGN